MASGSYLIRAAAVRQLSGGVNGFAAWANEVAKRWLPLVLGPSVKTPARFAAGWAKGAVSEWR
jgi:hypothetical protein